MKSRISILTLSCFIAMIINVYANNSTSDSRVKKKTVPTGSKSNSPTATKEKKPDPYSTDDTDDSKDEKKQQLTTPDSSQESNTTTPPTSTSNTPASNVAATDSTTTPAVTTTPSTATQVKSTHSSWSVAVPSKTTQPITPTTTPISSTPKASYSIENNNKFYMISDFIIPDGLQLHIKIWKDAKETEEYFEYIAGVGINSNGKTEQYPIVAALCCIKYGIKGSLKPYAIDLNNGGKGLTDLPGCEVNNANKPAKSLIVKLPKKAPDMNL
jgi:hypothetical protein